MNEAKERGAASVRIELSKGVITVYHGTDGVKLVEWTANEGDWTKLWERIEDLREAGL